MPFENKKGFSTTTNIDVKEERDTLKKELDILYAIKEQMDKHVKGITALEQEFLTTQEKWSGLQQEIRGQEVILEQLKTQITEKRNRVADATNELGALQEAYTTLSVEHQDLLDGATALHEQHNKILGDVKEATAIQVELQQNHEKIKAARETDLAGLINQIQSKKEEILHLNQCLSGMGDKVTELQVIIIKIQEEIKHNKVMAENSKILAKTAEEDALQLERSNALKRAEILKYQQDHQKPLEELQIKLQKDASDLARRENILEEKRAGLRELKSNLEFQSGKTFPNIFI